MKDIFIDADIANSFPKPSDSIKELINWLIDEDSTANSIIVYSNQLYKEYDDGNKGCVNTNSILYILGTMIKEGRYTKINNKEIQKFMADHCSKFKFSCNYKDRRHFPLIFLSERKMALVKDKKFDSDIRRFPKCGKYNFVAILADDPKDLNYK